MGSPTAPTVIKRPFGASDAMYLYHGKLTLTVDMMQSNDPRSAFKASTSLVFTTLCAPRLLSSVSLSIDVVKAVTSHPQARAN